MVMNLYKITFVILAILNASNAFTESGIKAIFSFFTDFGNKTEELGISIGNCTHDFLDFVRYKDRHMCALDDHFIAHLLPSIEETYKPPPIMAKCLPAESRLNTTDFVRLRIMTSVKDIVALLKPIGNATKRNEPGSCVFILFYRDACLGCARAAPYAHMLPHKFPSLQFAAIDSNRFPSFNTEFGIVGLPTLLLFHQGRPIIKFYSEARTFDRFVTKHTGVHPVEWSALPSPLVATAGPLPLYPIRSTDYVLLLAWTFILLCVGKYFAKSRLCQQIVEMIKRNWRESEAQLEHN